MVIDICNTEHKQDDHRIRRYNSVLEGINRIFSIVIQAKTEEELGIACLSVAIDMTDSQIGFVGIVGTDGLLHDIAISDMGLAQCKMYDKTGHHRLPGNFIFHGLYGRVVDSGTGFFTNEPLSHPDSIVLPQGYPPLTSFLSVPLILEGKTVGMISVANREGGYSYEQQEDLEAIAPAIMQALHRKREEKERERAEEALRVSEERLRLLSDNLLDSAVYQYTHELDGSVRFLYISAGIERLNGIKVSDVLSDPGTLHRQIPQTYFEQLVEAEARSARELSDFDMEIPMLRPDGQVRWMRLHSHPRRLPDGRTIWDGVQTDITELKQAEEERKKLLREVDEACKRFETVVENSPVGICVWRGPDLVYELANPAYHVFAPGKQFLGKTYAEVWPEAIEPHMSIIRRVMETGEPYYATDVPVPIRRNSNDPLEDRFFNIFYSALPPDTSGRVGVLNITVETTERKRAEEALMKIHKDLEEKIKERTAELEKSYNSLKESERRLSEAQKMAHLGSWDRDIATDEIYWSDEAYRIYGLSPQEFKITYNMFLSYVHPDDRDYVNNTIKKVLYGKPYSIDFRIIAADGVERIVHSQGEVTFDERNKPVRAKGTVQDITEYKKAEEKIQSLANIVESSNDAIITESLDGIITSWNKGAERIYGYSAKEILGKPMSVLEPSILAGEKKELVKLVKQGEVIQQYETLRLRKDSTIINVSITLSPVFDMYGKLAAVSVIYRDITERKRAEERLRESEEKYRNIVETANEGIFIINNEAVITYANKKVTDMIGYSLEEGIGRPVWEFISDESKALAKLSLESRQQGINESYELKLIRKDGLPLWVLINVKSLFDKDGRFMGSLSMFTDITERKEAERTLDKIQIARQKEIHHRIKNNLQVISSLLDLQAGKFNNKEHIRDSEVLEAFKESQDRVTSIALIHEELHEEEGKTTDTLNFPIYLQRLVKNLFRTYTLGNIDISLNLDLKENIFFDMDTAVPLGIIVNELVSNSLKHAFSGRNKGIIQIKLFSEEAGNEPNSKRKLSMEKLIKEKLAEEELAEEELAKEELAKERIPGKSTGYTLIVSDDGIGIPEEIDIKNPETLGLQLVNILVDQLDGKIKLEREHGTEFIINFSVEEKNN